MLNLFLIANNICIPQVVESVWIVCITVFKLVIIKQYVTFDDNTYTFTQVMIKRFTVIGSPEVHG